MELQELQRKWLLMAKLKTFIVTQICFYHLAQAESFVIHLLQTYLQREAKLVLLNTKVQKKTFPGQAQLVPRYSLDELQCQAVPRPAAHSKH